jgi:RHH-type proline utilization regulon transcriptional repressor/proline dehydrogenase/delta 1-pyrroline-5-carboxylate dehydrogenase
MDRLAEDPRTKAALFRLVDVAPMCRSRRDLAEHLAALLDEVDSPPASMELASRAAAARLTAPARGSLAAATVRTMAEAMS